MDKGDLIRRDLCKQKLIGGDLIKRLEIGFSRSRYQSNPTYLGSPLTLVLLSCLSGARRPV
jgi:hypothetical protein